MSDDTLPESLRAASGAFNAWADKTRYEHIVRTGTDVCPDLVDENTFGPHRSAVAGSPKRRIWAFRDEEGARLFVTYVNRGEFRRGRS